MHPMLSRAGCLRKEMDLQKSDEKFLIHSDIGTVEDRSQDITSFKDASTFPNPKEGQTFPKVC